MTNTEKKITKRDNFNEIIEILEDAERQDLIDVIKHEIELLDKKAASAKAVAAKKKATADPLMDAVLAALTPELQTIADIANKVEMVDVTVAKCQYRLNKLVDNGSAIKEQVIVPSESGKSRKIMAYRLA